jgi:hemerythrin superfamily protein
VDPMSLLKRQHREVEDLFGQVQEAEDPDTRRELLDQIVEKLNLHMSIEEELFYPAVREASAKSAHEMTDEAFEEHHVVKLVIADLPKADPDGEERFPAKMKVFSELIQHHVEEEEKEMFKLAKKLGKEELSALGEQMSARAGDSGGSEDGEDTEDEPSSGSPRGRKRRRT